jgi:hypothetical protein
VTACLAVCIGGDEPTEEGDVLVKAVPPAKGRGSARHSNAGPIRVSLGSSLFALSFFDSRHGPVGLMLAFGQNFYLGKLDYNFHDGRVVISVCVCVRGVRFRFVGGLGAPPSRLATVESCGGGGGNEPTDEEGVPVKVVLLTKGRGSARHSNEGPIILEFRWVRHCLLSFSVSRHGPFLGLMLAFGWIFFVEIL